MYFDRWDIAEAWYRAMTDKIQAPRIIPTDSRAHLGEIATSENGRAIYDSACSRMLKRDAT